MATELLLYDSMLAAIDACHATDEVLTIHDKAAALAAYARQTRNHAAERKCAEIRIRAERRLGELIIEQKATIGLAPAGRPPKIGSDAEPINKTPTLAELGICRKLSSRAQKLAAIPLAKFEEKLASAVIPTAAAVLHSAEQLERAPAESGGLKAGHSSAASSDGVARAKRSAVVSFQFGKGPVAAATELMGELRRLLDSGAVSAETVLRFGREISIDSTTRFHDLPGIRAEITKPPSKRIFIS